MHVALRAIGPVLLCFLIPDQALALPESADLAEAKSELRKALLSGWSVYDPAIRQAYLEKQVARRPVVAAAQETPKEATPHPAPPPASVATPTINLPKMVVEGTREKVKPLPRQRIAPPARVTKQEPWESPEGRAQRLVQKHITPLDKALNGQRLPLVGVTLVDRAKQKEAAETAERDLNDVADVLDMLVLTGLDTPEELKALRAEYWKAYYNRPRE
ncbi:MAG TPA: hypothetical protein VG734_16575 [Lacunisphaera sp.]|nr:hypothetical protein [Lacunisphaera sp.]